MGTHHWIIEDRFKHGSNQVFLVFRASEVDENWLFWLLQSTFCDELMEHKGHCFPLRIEFAIHLTSHLVKVSNFLYFWHIFAVKIRIWISILNMEWYVFLTGESSNVEMNSSRLKSFLLIMLLIELMCQEEGSRCNAQIFWWQLTPLLWLRSPWRKPKMTSNYLWIVIPQRAQYILPFHPLPYQQPSTSTSHSELVWWMFQMLKSYVLKKHQASPFSKF